jgi:hypothetical protein
VAADEAMVGDQEDVESGGQEEQNGEEPARPSPVCISVASDWSTKIANESI